MHFADKYSDLKLFLRNHLESKDLRPHAFSPRSELRPTQPFKCGCAAVRDTGTNRRCRNYFHIVKEVDVFKLQSFIEGSRSDLGSGQQVTEPGPGGSQILDPVQTAVRFSSSGPAGVDELEPDLLIKNAPLTHRLQTWGIAYLFAWFKGESFI